MKPFFNVLSVRQVHGFAQKLNALPSETVPLFEAGGRVLAQDFKAPVDLPGFDRSTMDGYAVRSQDTFGASETSPAYLELCGQVLMGHKPDFEITPGHCAKIGTGGMLPKGADAVVMVEHTRSLDGTAVELSTSLAPGAHVLRRDDDAAAGEVLLPSGHRLRPQDVGLLAALGVSRAAVRRRPRVGIISTGDEVVPVETQPMPGQVRDVNTHTIYSQVTACGGKPVSYGLAADDKKDLTRKVEISMQENHITLLSGGSSVGVRDLTAEVFSSFEGAKLLVHGVGVSPGKPFIWVKAGDKQLLGLPGQVASCLISFFLFVEPIMERLLGRDAEPFTRFGRQKAVLRRPVPSVPGREEYVRARLLVEKGQITAEPVFGKSGLLSTLIKSQGLLMVEADSEGLYAGDEVEILLFPVS
jgi:molybdopterin molybdotransferase